MKRSFSCFALTLFSCLLFREQGAAQTSATAAVQPGSGEERLIFDNWNKEAVNSGPSAPTRFTLFQPCMITYVNTYHWNNAQGKFPGTIGLRHQDGTLYGPWRAAALPGSGVNNVIWVVRPNALLRVGTYTVVDSDPATWSQNIQSQRRGFSQVKGIFQWTSPDSRTVIVPSLIGISHQQGHARLQAIGLTLKHAVEPSPNTLIRGQNPPAGTVVMKGSAVTVTFGDAIIVPNLVGLAHDVAEKQLANLGLFMKHAGDPAASAKVAYQNPIAGTQVNRGSSVTVAFQEAVTVPGILGLKHDAAHQQVEKLGLRFMHGAEPGDQDVVETQDPAAGTQVAAGSTVQGVFAPLSKVIADELKKAAAKSGDVQISLYWTNKSDLDLHVVCPSGENISYSNKQSKCGGELDIDHNAQFAKATMNAVENVYWPKGKAPAGNYKIYVHFYGSHGNQAGCADPSPFNVRVVVQGKTQVFQGTVGTKITRKVLVHEFNLLGGGAADTAIAKIKQDRPVGPVPQTNFGYRGTVVIQGNPVPELVANLHFTIKGNTLTGSLEAPAICETNRRLFGAAVQLAATLPNGFQWEGPIPITGTLTGDILECPGRRPIPTGSTFTLSMKGKSVVLTTTGLYYNSYLFGQPMGQVYTVRDTAVSSGTKSLGAVIPYTEASREIQAAFSHVPKADIDRSSGVVMLAVNQTFTYTPYHTGFPPFVRKVLEPGPISLTSVPGVAAAQVAPGNKIELTGKAPGYGQLRFRQPVKVEVAAPNFQTETRWLDTEGIVFVVVKSPAPPPAKEKTLTKVVIRGRAIRRDTNQPVAGALVQLISDRGKGAKYPPPLVVEGVDGGFLGVDQSDKWKTNAKGEFEIVAEDMIPEGQFELFLIRFNPDSTPVKEGFPPVWMKDSYEKDLWPVKYYLINITREGAERGSYDVGTIVLDTVENLWGTARKTDKVGTGRQGIEWRGGGPPQ